MMPSITCRSARLVAATMSTPMMATRNTRSSTECCKYQWSGNYPPNWQFFAGNPAAAGPDLADKYFRIPCVGLLPGWIVDGEGHFVQIILKLKSGG